MRFNYNLLSTSLVLATGILLHAVWSFPNGELLQMACADMRPQHGTNTPNLANSPFSIYVGNLFPNNTFLLNELLIVSINTTGVNFIGFMLQGKTISKGELIAAPADGYWKATDSFSKTLDCFSIKKSTLVHASNTPLKTMTAYWVPTKYTSGKYIIQGTVMASFSNYYTNIQSNEFKSSSISNYKTTNNSFELKKFQLIMFQVFLFLLYFECY